jgi:hypothetical protein
MKIETKDELKKEAQAYIDASQKLKAAKEVLAERREAIIPAFNKLCRADEDGNRTLKFGNSKIMLVPIRKVDEQELKDELGPHADRFTEKYLTIQLHLIQSKLGKDVAKQVEQAIRNAVSTVLSDHQTLRKQATKLIRQLDTPAALASLDKEAQDRVKEEVSESLRPYPESEGYEKKVEAAAEWLDEE